MRPVSYTHLDVYKRQGGTIGDIESQPFIEAARQVSLELGRQNSLFIHVTLVPFLKGSGEHKSKPVSYTHLDVYKRQD